MFARFRESDAESHLARVPDSGSMDLVEARITDRVRRLHPRPFQMLDEFCARHAEFVDSVARGWYASCSSMSATRITSPDWKAYPLYIRRWSTSGRTPRSRAVSTSRWHPSRQFDSASLVPNDFALADAERIAVVTGPNQGGKTTFSRMVGQLHYLAALGVPVPAQSAQLMLCDKLFTLYSRPEDVTTLRGRLDQELFETKQILDQATDRTLVLLNEVFASTTLADAVYLGTRVINQLVEIGCAAVWVTFLDELAGLGEATLASWPQSIPGDPTKRTLEVVPKAADGRAYASAIAEKYGLTHDQLPEVAE